MSEQVQWLRQIRLARYMLLGTVIATLVNIVLLLNGADMQIPYCAALPFYLVWLGNIFDNGMVAAGPVVGEFTYTGMLICFVLLSAWLVVWFLARGSRRWLQVGMAFVIADTAILLLITLVLFENPVSSLLELVLHGAVLWKIIKGIRAYDQLAALQQAQVQQEIPAES